MVRYKRRIHGELLKKIRLQDDLYHMIMTPNNINVFF